MLYNAMVFLTRASCKRRSLKLLVLLRRSKPRLPKEENTFKPELTTSTTFELAIDHAFTVTNKSSSENGTDDLSSTTNLYATYYALSPRDQVEEKERDIPYSPCICVPSLGRRGHERCPVPRRTGFMCPGGVRKRGLLRAGDSGIPLRLRAPFAEKGGVVKGWRCAFSRTGPGSRANLRGFPRVIVTPYIMIQLR